MLKAMKKQESRVKLYVFVLLVEVTFYLMSNELYIVESRAKDTLGQSSMHIYFHFSFFGTNGLNVTF